MKKYIAICFIGIITVLSSCKKWIDVTPGSMVKQEELFSSESGFQQAHLGNYVQMGDGLYNDLLTSTFISALAQNYQTSTSNHFLQEYAKYNYNNPTVRASIDLIWSKMYNTIAGINNILAQIDDSKVLFTKNHYNLIKGESLGLRAYLHFDLLRMFGPIPNLENQSPAIPYITKFDKNVTPLGNVETITNACLSDLDEAEKLLSVFQEIIYDKEDADEYTIYTRNHFNYWAVKALKARIYLYKGDREQAYKYAKEVIASGKFPFVDRSTFNAGINQDRTFSTEHIFALHIPYLTKMADAYFKIDGNPNYQRGSLYLPSSTTRTLFDVNKDGATDYRYLYLIASSNNVFYSTKFWQNDAAIMQVHQQMPMIRLAEMYYIAAEASNDLSESKELVNKIRVQRGLPALTITFTEKSKMTEIAKEYNKEFYAEGQTFYYYKRLGIIPIPRASISMNEKTYVFPLPEDEIEFGNRN